MSASNASRDSIKLFGKQRETALLAETAESDRLPHGIMLTGEKGIGKRTFAKWCAMLYLCREPENKRRPLTSFLSVLPPSHPQ